MTQLDDAFTRRVRRRIAEEQKQTDIIAKSRDSMITCELVAQYPASALGDELSISLEDAECLKMSDEDWEKSVFSLMHRMAAHFGPETNVAARARSAIESIVARTNLSTVDWTTISHTDKKALPLVVRHWLKGQGVDLENGMKESESNQEADLSHTVVPATSRSAQIENGIENPEETICKAVDDDDVQDSQEFKCTGDAEIALKDAHSATRDVAEIRSDRAEDHSNVGDNGSHVLGQLVSAASDDSSVIQNNQMEHSIQWAEGQRIEIFSPAGDWQAGTIGFVRIENFVPACAVVVIDLDGSLRMVQCRLGDTVRYIQGPPPEHFAWSLVAVFLKAHSLNRGISHMIEGYLAGQDANKLKAVASSSWVLEQKNPDLRFCNVIGQGGYGTVFSAHRHDKVVAVKMEVACGSTEYLDISIWREYHFLHSPPKNLSPYVPKLENICKSSPFFYVHSHEKKVAFLGMEFLVEHASTTFRETSLLESSAGLQVVPDSFRILAKYQCLIIARLKEAGLSHGDIKNGHFMYRLHDQSVVLVDWGLAQRSEFVYTTTKKVRVDSGRIKENCIQHCPPNVPAGKGAAPAKQQLKQLGLARQGTCGYRTEHDAVTSDERHNADLWALAVGWLAGVGLRPSTKEDGKKIEEMLYVSSRESLDFFEKRVAEFTGTDHASFHSTVRTWLKLIHTVFQGGVNVLNLLNSSPALTEPFYKPSTWEELRSKGIIIRGLNTSGKESENMKPLLMMHLDHWGIILLCLLFYRENERIAFYGGEHKLKVSDEMVLFPTHTLSLTDPFGIIGGVSNRFQLEDYIEHPAVGSFFKSSRREPKIMSAGSVCLPARQRNPTVCENGMTVTAMYTRLPHGPGTQPSWCYDWNAGKGGDIFTEQQVNAMQDSVNQPLPPHVWRAVAAARARVLSDGVFQDASLTQEIKIKHKPAGMPTEIYTPMCLAATTPAQEQCDPHSPPPQDTVQPLSPDLVCCIEDAWKSSDGTTHRISRWDPKKASTGATYLDDTQALESAGFCVLDHVPKKKTKIVDQALLLGQGVVFMDGAGIALKSAESLKTVTGIGEELFSRVFDRRECQSGVASAKNASDKPTPDEGEELKGSSSEGQSSGAGQSDEEGSEDGSSGAQGQPRKAGKSGSGSGRPEMASWLLVVAIYIASLPDKAWSTIFQNMDGDKEARVGDGLRSESKGLKWEIPKQKEGEERPAFLDRMAGYYALKYFYEALFLAIIRILPSDSNFSSQLYDSMYSLLASDGRNGNAGAQDPHNDIKPARSRRHFSALFNLSEMFSFIGILLNSCPNIKAMFKFDDAEFEGFMQQFLVTKSSSQPEKLLSEIMGDASMDTKVRFAWSHYFRMNKPKHFLPMKPVYAKMPSIWVALFDTDTVHWGPPFPMPGIEYPIKLQGLRLIHYR